MPQATIPIAGPVAWYRTLLSFLEAGRPFAVLTVLKAEASTPVPTGAKAIVESTGVIHGTVGGGAVEARAQRQAMLAINSGEPVIFDFDLGGPGVHEASPICGGFMRLLVAPANSATAGDYRRAIAVLEQRRRGIWLTTLHTRPGLKVETQFVREEDLAREPNLPEGAHLRSCLDQGQSRLFPGRQTADGGNVEVFLEPVIPPPLLVIVGGGHVGQAVAAQASLLGFEIVVIEDRPEFTHGALFPSKVQTRCGPLTERLAEISIDPDTFIVLVSRGHQQDSLALRACIRQPAAYIGMIGSRRKVPLLRRQFLNSGWANAEEFDRVYAPIGLDIGAVTVPEIAAAIVAQMIAVRRQGTAPKMPLR